MERMERELAELRERYEVLPVDLEEDVLEIVRDRNRLRDRLRSLGVNWWEECRLTSE